MVDSNDGDGDVSVLLGEAMRSYICELSYMSRSRDSFMSYSRPKAFLLGGSPVSDFHVEYLETIRKLSHAKRTA